MTSRNCIPSRTRHLSFPFGRQRNAHDVPPPRCNSNLAASEATGAPAVDMIQFCSFGLGSRSNKESVHPGIYLVFVFVKFHINVTKNGAVHSVNPSLYRKSVLKSQVVLRNACHAAGGSMRKRCRGSGCEI